jgi:hypothetical protein
MKFTKRGTSESYVEIALVGIQSATATIRDHGQFPANRGSVAIALYAR